MTHKELTREWQLERANLIAHLSYARTLLAGCEGVHVLPEEGHRSVLPARFSELEAGLRFGFPRHDDEDAAVDRLGVLHRVDHGHELKHICEHFGRIKIIIHEIIKFIDKLFHLCI